MAWNKTSTTWSLTSDLLCRMYTEVQAEDVAISLFIKRLADEDAGQYRCTAVYAGNRELEATVSVSIFRECGHLLLVTYILFPQWGSPGWTPPPRSTPGSTPTTSCAARSRPTPPPT